MQIRQTLNVFVNQNHSISIEREEKEQRNFEFIKRAIDISLSILFLVTIGWIVLLIIPIAIRIDSKGSVIFRQTRNGFLGKKFTCYKFRTMKVGECKGFQQATENDSRVTRLGRFLRKTSLDELPQIFNVLNGDMSLVGPRPHPVPLDDEYSQKLNSYLHRYDSKPGLTGLAQINGYRGETATENDMKSRLRMDLLYVKRKNLLLDLFIILKSFVLIFKGDPNAF
jgi:lipopolysaccharide/colanic/teichoic acid biosynthesis glycosyltransferase